MSGYCCRKCKQWNNWFHGYCIECWGQLPQEKRGEILAREIINRAMKKMRRTYEVA